MRWLWLLIGGLAACGGAPPADTSDSDTDTDTAELDTDAPSAEIAACRAGVQVFELVDGAFVAVASAEGDAVEQDTDAAGGTDDGDGGGFVPDPDERLYLLSPGAYRVCPGEQRLKLRSATGAGTLNLQSLDPDEPAVLRSTGPLELRGDRVEVSDIEVFGGASRFVGFRIEAEDVEVSRVTWRELVLAGRVDVLNELTMSDVRLVEVSEGPRLRAGVTTGPVPSATLSGARIEEHRGGVLLSWDGVDLSLSGLRVEGGSSRGLTDATTSSASQRGSIRLSDVEVVDHEALTLFSPVTSLDDVRVVGGRFERVIEVEQQYASLGPPGPDVDPWELAGLEVREAYIGDAVLGMSVAARVAARDWLLVDLDLGARGHGVRVGVDRAVFTCTDCVFDGLRRDPLSTLPEGALLVGSSGEAVLEGVVFRNNESASGPAVYLEKGTLTLTDVLFETNRATGDGGAMWVGPRYKGLSFNGDTRFEDNEAGGNGGALAIDGQQLVFDDPSATLVGLHFEGNRADGHGGALWSSKDVMIRLRDCTFLNNEASVGGAVSAEPLRSATDCVFEGNLATVRAGVFSAAYIENDSFPPASEDFPEFIRCTFHGNTAPDAGIGESRARHASGSGAMTGAGQVRYVNTDFGSGGTANVTSTVRLGNVVKQLSGSGRTGTCRSNTVGATCP